MRDVFNVACCVLIESSENASRAFPPFDPDVLLPVSFDVFGVFTFSRALLPKFKTPDGPSILCTALS